MMELIAMKLPTRPFVRWWLALLPGIVLAVVCLPVARGDELMRQVQEELRRRNLYFGDVDGRTTTQIAAAVRRYQQRKGFTASGEVDDTTLRSLSLLAPVAAASVTNGEGPPSGPAATVAAVITTTVLPPVPWPDLPVLHSDQGREHPHAAAAEEEIIDPTPPPALKPPPAAVTQTRVDEAGHTGFVMEYLRTGQSNVPGIQESFYAKRVDYFNEGVVDDAFIAKDTARYNKRWPVRQFTLLEPVTTSVPPDGNPKRLIVEFHCGFVVRQPDKARPLDESVGKTVRGETKNIYVLERVGPGPDDWKLASIKEERVRGK